MPKSTNAIGVKLRIGGARLYGDKTNVWSLELEVLIRQPRHLPGLEEVAGIHGRHVDHSMNSHEAGQQLNAMSADRLRRSVQPIELVACQTSTAGRRA